MPRIAVLGSLHTDVVVHTPYRPRKGETIKGSAWSIRGGGKGGIQAIHAAQHGAEVYMIGRIGLDDFGQRQHRALKEAGVDTTYVLRDENDSSGMSVSLIDAEGQYGTVIIDGVNEHIDQSDIDRAATCIQSVDCLIMQYETPLETVVLAADYAQRYDTRVILNAAPAHTTPEGLFKQLDVLILNMVEAALVANRPVNSIDDARTTAEILSEQVPTVIITAGAEGVVLQDRQEGSAYMPGYQVQVVDTHSAGDVFIGAFAARWIAGDTVIDAVKYANAASALTIMRASDEAPTITLQQVQDFMQEQDKRS